MDALHTGEEQIENKGTAGSSLAVPCMRQAPQLWRTLQQVWLSLHECLGYVLFPQLDAKGRAPDNTTVLVFLHCMMLLRHTLACVFGPMHYKMIIWLHCTTDWMDLT